MTDSSGGAGRYFNPDPSGDFLLDNHALDSTSEHTAQLHLESSLTADSRDVKERSAQFLVTRQLAGA